MAYFNGTFFSQSLKRPVHFTAVLCNDNAWIDPANKYLKGETKNVYLLHGYSGCDTDWPLNAPLQEFANKYNVNFFMPNIENSFYLDQAATGFKYAEYAGKEFVEYTRKTFNLSTKRENTYIGGLSMGGFGAIHTGLLYNNTFGGIIALSSALIINELHTFKPGMDNGMANYEYYNLIFGDLNKVKETDKNPEVLLKNLVEKGQPIPKIYIACGTEDFLYQPNVEFKTFLEKLNVPFTYNEGPGIHDFNFWRAYLPKGLETLIG